MIKTVLSMNSKLFVLVLILRSTVLVTGGESKATLDEFTESPAAAVNGEKNFPPRLLSNVYQPSIRLYEGTTNVALPCPVEARPRPLVSWTKDGEVISSGLVERRIAGPVHRRGVLFLRVLHSVDAGLYTCSAVNGFGKLRISIQIIVTDNTTTVNPEKNQPTTIQPSNNSPTKDFVTNNYVVNTSSLETRTIDNATQAESNITLCNDTETESSITQEQKEEGLSDVVKSVIILFICFGVIGVLVPFIALILCACQRRLLALGGRNSRPTDRQEVNLTSRYISPRLYHPKMQYTVGSALTRDWAQNGSPTAMSSLISPSPMMTSPLISPSHEITPLFVSPSHIMTSPEYSRSPDWLIPPSATVEWRKETATTGKRSLLRKPPQSDLYSTSSSSLSMTSSSTEENFVTSSYCDFVGESRDCSSSPELARVFMTSQFIKSGGLVPVLASIVNKLYADNDQVYRDQGMV